MEPIIVSIDQLREIFYRGIETGVATACVNFGQMNQDRATVHAELVSLSTRTDDAATEQIDEAVMAIVNNQEHPGSSLAVKRHRGAGES